MNVSVSISAGYYNTSGKDEVKRVSSAYRNHSIDARGWADPYVTEDEIKEKVLIRYFPHMGRIR